MMPDGFYRIEYFLKRTLKGFPRTVNWRLLITSRLAAIFHGLSLCPKRISRTFFSDSM